MSIAILVIYTLFFIAATHWVGRDAASRGMDNRFWGAGTFISGMLGLVAYLFVAGYQFGMAAAIIAVAVVIVGWFVIYAVRRGPVTGSPLEHSIDDTIESIIVNVPRFIIGSLILFGIAVNFGNIVGRYFFLAPIIWAEEIMIYIMVWTVFVGAALVTWDGRHLKMDFFSIMMKSPWREIMFTAGLLTFLVVCVMVLPQSYTVFTNMVTLDQRSVVAEVPMAIPHFAVVLGFVLMLLGLLFRFRSHATGNLESEIDELVSDSDDGGGIDFDVGGSDKKS